MNVPRESSVKISFRHVPRKRFPSCHWETPKPEYVGARQGAAGCKLAQTGGYGRISCAVVSRRRGAESRMERIRTTITQIERLFIRLLGTTV